MFFEQLKRLCKEKGTTPTALVKKLGLSASNVTSWKNGASPRKDVLEKIAKELTVPVSKLFENETESEEEKELITIYRQLDRPKKIQLMGKAYELKESQDSKSGSTVITPPDIDLVASRLGMDIKK